LIRRNTSWWINWTGAAFISFVLGLLVLVPVVQNIHSHNLRVEIREHAQPAQELANDIEAALSHGLSAVVGFQDTGETNYADVYRQQRSIIVEKLAQLERLTPKLGPAADLDLKALRRSVDAWHQDIESHRMVSIQLPPGEFRERLHDRDYFLQAADEAAADFEQGLAIWQDQKLEAIASTERLSAIITAILAVLAMASILLIHRIVRRLKHTTADLQRRASEEEAQREVAHSLTVARSLDDVLDRITHSAVLAVDADSVYIEATHPENNEVTLIAARGNSVVDVGTKGPFTGSFAEDVLRTSRSKIVDHVTSGVPSMLGLLAQDCGDCSAIVVPLISELEPLGALVLVRHHPRKFQPEEIPRVRVFADMAAVAMRRAATIEELRKLQEQDHFLSEAAKVLASSLEYESTLKTAAQLAIPEMADWCAVHLSDDNGKIRTAAVAHIDTKKLGFAQQIKEDYQPRAERDVGAFRVIRTGQAELYSEFTDELLKSTAQDARHHELLKQLNLKSAMVVPLFTGNRTFGALTFASEQARRYGPDDLVFAEEVARHAAFSIQNARLYAESKRALKTRDEVLAVVSHDLRNPVSNIEMTASMLLNSSLPEDKRKDMLEIIKRSATRMNRLIEDLIAVARVQAGQPIPLQIQAENPIKIVQEACQSVAVKALSKSIRLTCEMPAALPLVKADRHRVFQVLLNLLDNALKFTADGGSVTVRCEPFEQQVRFSVRDTGRGIEPSNVDRIFDLFWQAKVTAHLGAGFGLAIAKSIVEQHGGKIWVQSQPGAGSTFFFTLPQAAASETLKDERQAS